MLPSKDDDKKPPKRSAATPKSEERASNRALALPKAEGIQQGAARLYRSERLKSQSAIQALFDRRSASVSAYPLRLVYAPAEQARGGYPVQLAVSVPKRRFKRAVDRNRIKRLMREAYRLNKESLYERLPAGSPQYAWMLIYTGKEELSYRRVEKKMRQVLDRFLKEVQ
ncbi:ribonuclease P protein component [Lewinellaceae bacterium SD302]|nr:ribonuclease P protein component [Lewinellaceae bacterium SD302]